MKDQQVREEVSWIEKLLFAVVAFNGITYLAHEMDFIRFPGRIPRVSKVQKDSIAPDNVRVNCYDLDGNGEEETVLNLQGRAFSLKVENGRPYLQEFKMQEYKK